MSKKINIPGSDQEIISQEKVYVVQSGTTDLDEETIRQIQTMELKLSKLKTYHNKIYQVLQKVFEDVAQNKVVSITINVDYNDIRSVLYGDILYDGLLHDCNNMLNYKWTEEDFKS